MCPLCPLVTPVKVWIVNHHRLVTHGALATAWGELGAAQTHWQTWRGCNDDRPTSIWTMVEHLWKSLKLAQKQDSKASAKTRLSKNNPHMHRVLLSSEHKGKREETNLRRREMEDKQRNCSTRQQSLAIFVPPREHPPPACARTHANTQTPTTHTPYTCVFLLAWTPSSCCWLAALCRETQEGYS